MVEKINGDVSNNDCVCDSVVDDGDGDGVGVVILLQSTRN